MDEPPFPATCGGALVLSAALSACYVAPVGPGPGPGGEVVAYAAPPPVQYEAVGVAPYPGAFWIGGSWFWAGGRYVWRGGYWESAATGLPLGTARLGARPRGWRKHPATGRADDPEPDPPGHTAGAVLPGRTRSICTPRPAGGTLCGPWRSLSRRQSCSLRSGHMIRTASIAGACLAAAAIGPLAAQSAGKAARRDAGAFTLTSTDIAAGGNIAEAQVFNGFGCKGGNISPALALERRARRHQELRAPGARSGCAHRQRLVALGRLQHSREPRARCLPAPAIRARACCPPARCRAAPTSAHPATAARARRRASRITTTSGSTRSKSRSSTCPRMPPPPTSASACTHSRSARHELMGVYGR